VRIELCSYCHYVIRESMKHSVLKVLNYITGDAEPIKAIHGIRSSPAGNHHRRSLPCLWLTLCRKLCFF